MTNFDRLGEVWRREDGDRPARRPAEDLAATRARAARLRWLVRRRDWIETGTALAMVPVFAWMALTIPYAISALGAAIVATACVFIPIRLWTARRGAPDPALPVAQALAAELARIRAQERLLRSVAWWYLTPLGAGVILFVAGAPVPPLVKVAYAVVVIALYAWLLRLNLRAVRRDLQPVARELEGWLAGLNDTSFNGGSDAP